jgi:hypothetical protein
MSNREWLEQLQKELHEYHPPTYARGRMSGYGHWTEKRNLTEDEWEKLTKILDEDDTLTTSLGTRFGFTLEMGIYENAPYPGTDPKFLLYVNQKQLPEKLGTTGATLGGAGDSWQTAWTLFTKWTHSDRNAEKLKFHGMEAPKEQSYYDY